MSVPRRFLVVLTSVLAAVSAVSLGAAGPAIGDKVQLWTSDGGDNQLWYPYPD